MTGGDGLRPQFQAIVDVADAQVVLDVVQSVSEQVALGARLGDRLADAADDRRDDEDAEQVVDGHDDALELGHRVVLSYWVVLGHRVVHLADGQQQHRRPVDAEEVVVGQAGGRGGRVHPAVAAESDPGAQLVVDAGVPVDRQDDDDSEYADPQRVRVVGPRLGVLQELGEATEAQQPVEADVGGGGAQAGVQSVSR